MYFLLQSISLSFSFKTLVIYFTKNFWGTEIEVQVSFGLINFLFNKDYIIS